MEQAYTDGGFKLGWAKHKGIASYALSANRQRPFAGALNAAIFNTARRSRNQILYVVPPFILAYGVMQWAIERLVATLDSPSYQTLFLRRLS